MHMLNSTNLLYLHHGMQCGRQDSHHTCNSWGPVQGLETPGLQGVDSSDSLSQDHSSETQHGQPVGKYRSRLLVKWLCSTFRSQACFCPHDAWDTHSVCASLLPTRQQWLSLHGDMIAEVLATETLILWYLLDNAVLLQLGQFGAANSPCTICLTFHSSSPPGGSRADRQSGWQKAPCGCSPCGWRQHKAQSRHVSVQYWEGIPNLGASQRATGS
jgi:hypothetical protein